MLSTFCRCSHRSKPQWGSHCFPPLPPTLPSQTNTGSQRSFLPDSSHCGVFKVTAKGPSQLSASQQPQALHFLFSPSRCGSARGKVWHKEDNERHFFWRRSDNPHESLSCQQLQCHCSRHGWQVNENKLMKHWEEFSGMCV